MAQIAVRPAGVLAGVRRIVLPELPRQPMDQPESMRPRTKAEGSPSRGRPPGKTPSVPQSPAAIPTVPDYDLLRRIGGGSYGEVWLARSKATGALRAAKIVWRNRFEDERPFRREFEGIRRFEEISRGHPSQLALFHIGRNDAEGYFYYVMELADDAKERKKEESTRELSTLNSQLSTFARYTPHTLRAELEHGRLPASRVLEIGLALAEALSHLHQNGLVHRDVKPSNVIFVKGRPKLADIGLVTDASDSRSIVGTEGYLPPDGLGTPQADIFALGKVLYEAAMGLDRRELPKLPDNLRTWPDAAQVFELNEIILKACAPDLKQRYQSCAELQADIALLERGKSIKQKRTRQRYWFAAKKAGIGLFAIAAIVAGASIWFQQVKPANLYPDGPPSTNMDANTLCTKGLLIIRSDNYSAFAEAYTNFHEAIKLDPHFVQPYVGLQELCSREAIPGLPPTTSEVLREIADKLQALGPNLAGTATAKSYACWRNWDFQAAIRLAKQATQINPSYELSHTWYGFVLTHCGWPLEGRRELEKAREVAPAKATVYRMMAHTYFAQRDFTNAILWYHKALDMNPHHATAYEAIGDAFMAMGDYTNALDNLEKSDIFHGRDETTTKRDYEGRRRALANGGVTGYWQHQWKWAENNTNKDFYWKAVIQINLGNTTNALYWLDRSYETQEGKGSENNLNYLLFDPSWDSLHGHPRFKHLLDEIGFSKVMPPAKK